MRGWRVIVVSLLALAGSVHAAIARAAHHRGPTPAQINRAVRSAEHSGALWATVNICDTPKYPHILGIRGQMPSLGFAAELRMTFEVDYWSYARSVFVPLAGVAQPVSLGTASRGFYQGGVRFAFAPHTGLLRGRVRFDWRINGRTVGSVERRTRARHYNARFGDPPRFSSWGCVIT